MSQSLVKTRHNSNSTLIKKIDKLLIQKKSPKAEDFSLKKSMNLNKTYHLDSLKQPEVSTSDLKLFNKNVSVFNFSQ